MAISLASKAGAELGTAQPQLVIIFYSLKNCLYIAILRNTMLVDEL